MKDSERTGCSMVELAFNIIKVLLMATLIIITLLLAIPLALFGSKD